jgi:NAD(P)-dependent dehydrogenase (short-subunit alcohol dehydrogenase family)
MGDLIMSNSDESARQAQQPRPNLRGKVVLITGATGGIGKAAAFDLAGMGATLVGVGRSAPKGDLVAQELRAATGNPNIHFLTADLTSMAQVRQLAADLRSRFDRLDVLINNAGAIFWERGETIDGFEQTWALNHLAYFVLTNALTDLLKASAPSRVVNTASNAHRMGAIDFDDLNSRKSYGAWRAYNQSKLANILFSNELALRLAGTGVTSNALHPGVVKTDFGSGVRGPVSVGFNVAKEIGAISPERGAQTTVYLASSPDVEGVTGQHFASCRPVEPAPQAQDMAVARRLWLATEAMLAPVLA